MAWHRTLLGSVAVTIVTLSACRDDSTSPTAPSGIEPAIGQATYSVRALAIPTNALLGEASDINDAGVAAGWYKINNTWFAARWTTPTAFQNLGTLPGFQSSLAKGINSAGTIVGYVVTSSFNASRAFVWTQAGATKPLQDLGGGGAIAFAINSSGVIVGESSTPTGAIHAVKWSPAGVVTDINPAGAGFSEATAINDAGDIAGHVFGATANGEHAWLWRANGTQQDLGTLGGQRSFGYGINSSVIVLGWSNQTPPKPDIGFGGSAANGMKPIGSFGGGSQALGISDRNRIVGFQVVNAGVVGLTTFQGIKTVLPDLAPQKGFPFSGPTAVNTCGTIVGSSVSPRPTNGNSVPAIWTKTGCD
jgi:probable HAF family extracellular repeat protein